MRSPSHKVLSRLSELNAQLDALESAKAPPPEPIAWVEERLGFKLDEWQRGLMAAGDFHRLLMVCPRQSGKSTIVGALAGYLLVSRPGIRVVVLSPTVRQSSMLTAKAADVLRDETLVTESATKLVLANGSSLDSLPGDRPATVRGATSDLLILDEASRVKDDLIAAALPMTAATDGSVIMLTTPAGASGSFYDFWTAEGDTEWKRVFVTIEQVSHYSKKTIGMMKRRLGKRLFAQEFGGRFLEPLGALFSADDIDELFTARAIAWSGPVDAPSDYEPVF